MAILSERDGRVWARLARRVAPLLDRLLSPNVLANRVVVAGDRWALAPFGPSLKRARRAAGRLARSASVLVRTDVEAFYPSIDPSVLHRCLRNVGADASDAAAAAEMVEQWGSEGTSGLPIGPPGSAVMANAVLRSVDDALSDLRFLRWVDDYLVALGSARQTDGALLRVDLALAELGLHRSVTKTRVEDAGSSRRWPGGDGSGLL